jgi:hypothetical protein
VFCEAGARSGITENHEITGGKIAVAVVISIGVNWEIDRL